MSPVSDAARPTQQPPLAITNTKNVATPINQPQASNNAAEVKTPPPVSDAARPTQQPPPAITNTKNVATPTKQPQASNNAAEVKTLSPVSDAARSPQQPEVANTSQNAATPIEPLQVAKANDAEVKALQPEPEAAQKSDQIAVSEPALKGDASNSAAPHESVGVRVSMNVPPPSMPVETKTVSPVSTKAPAPNLPLTKIYRVGPSDVLDIRLNDIQAPRSTLFTVTPSGLLEHPLLTEPLLVTGLTVEAIGGKMEDELIKRALIENPKVVVGVRDYASHAILVSGLVKDPGTKFLRREAIPLYVVVADAQPLPEAARVTLVRDGSNQIYEIDLMQVADMNLLVRPGDVVTLKPNVAQFIY
ncbi:MAG: polysaccharide biosynthesis/export family protein, partial [Pyrinomonadaceae bacterium]